MVVVSLTHLDLIAWVEEISVADRQDTERNRCREGRDSFDVVELFF